MVCLSKSSMPQHEAIWGGSPTAADRGLKIPPVRVRIPLALPVT